MSGVFSVVVGGTLVAAVAAGVATHASQSPSPGAGIDPDASLAASAPSSLVAQVREATAVYRDVNQAIAAGYQQFGGCVSGPQAGAMGVHFVKGSLVDDVLDVTQPEALVYEMSNGMARLVGVEYITPAPVWDASHQDPPILNGQHFHLMGTPNRYRLPALYELHVWAWRENPNGTFADWNPLVSCDGAE
jgi:hypothetical protein